MRQEENQVWKHGTASGHRSWAIEPGRKRGSFVHGPRTEGWVPRSTCSHRCKAVLSYHPPLEQVFVKSFEVGELAGLKFKLLGPGYVTPFFANQFIKAALATLNPLIKSTVERQGRNVLERSVKDSDFVKTVITQLA